MRTASARSRSLATSQAFPASKPKVSGAIDDGCDGYMGVVVLGQASPRDAGNEKGRRRVICGKLEILDNVRRF